MRAVQLMVALGAMGGWLTGCGAGDFAGWPERPGTGGNGPVGGTGGSGGVTPIQPVTTPIGELDRSLAQLRPATSCDELLEPLRLRLLVAVDAALQTNLERALNLANGVCPVPQELLALDGGGAVAAPPVAEPAESSGAESFTTTNLQDADVDEADFLKNDGEHFYVLADGALQILRAWPAAETAVVARIGLEGTPRSLFLEGDRLVVYESVEPIVPLGPDTGLAPECTYGYDCTRGADGRRLKISVLDISERAAPVPLRELYVDGSLIGARRTGSIVHTAVTFPPFALPGVAATPAELSEWVTTPCDQLDPAEFPYTEYEVRARFARQEFANIEALDAASIDDFLPAVTDRRLEGDETELERPLVEDCTSLYLPQDLADPSLMSLLSFDLADPTVLGVTTIVAKPGIVYASPSAFFLGVDRSRRYGEPWYTEAGVALDRATELHGFALEADAVATTYLGSGVVPGYVLNQFSLDEHDGDLRVASTVGYLGGADTRSLVTVLRPAADGLETIGVVDGIAPREDIRSVRFDGDTGYVVTFEKTDPLFVVDLADPEAPALRGELVIPGFSTYIHRLDDDHLLTIGYDADDQGSFSWFRGIKLQLIDVSDPEAPTVLHDETIGTRGTSSEAATNHLAFTYFRDRELLALPLTRCEGGEGGEYGEMTFSGLYVYRVTLEDGFEHLGGLSHPVDPTAYTCANWWTQSNSVVQRSVFMEDFVYAVALDRIDVAEVGELEEPVASVPLSAD